MSVGRQPTLPIVDTVTSTLGTKPDFCLASKHGCGWPASTVLFCLRKYLHYSLASCQPVPMYGLFAEHSKSYGSMMPIVNAPGSY